MGGQGLATPFSFALLISNTPSPSLSSPASFSPLSLGWRPQTVPWKEGRRTGGNTAALSPPSRALACAAFYPFFTEKKRDEKKTKRRQEKQFLLAGAAFGMTASCICVPFCAVGSLTCTYAPAGFPALYIACLSCSLPYGCIAWVYSALL